MTDKKSTTKSTAKKAEQQDPIEKTRQKEAERAVVVGSPTVPPPDPDKDAPGIPPGTVGA